MADFEVLRITLSGPSAHFRIIQSNNPRKSYPLPPYSTVIGLLANILGERKMIERMLKHSFALGILARHSFVTKEYTWMRNLSLKSHKQRFGSAANRMYGDVPEHMGDIAGPICVQVLNEVVVHIYVYHPEEQILSGVEKNISQPEKWLSHLHLGRSEDWVLPNRVCRLNLKLGNRPANFAEAASYYQWMPDYSQNKGKNVFWPHKTCVPEDYKNLYDRMPGTVTLVTTVYKKIEVPQGKGKKMASIRNFDHIPARICNSAVPWLNAKRYPSLYYDPELKTPVYLARISSSRRRDQDAVAG